MAVTIKPDYYLVSVSICVCAAGSTGARRYAQYSATGMPIALWILVVECREKLHHSVMRDTTRN